MKTNWILRRIAFLVLTASVVACSSDSPEQLIAAAKASIEKHDRKTAVIQLKNLLQQNPSSVEGRLLLGRLQLEAGDALGAGVEFAKALDLGATPDGAVPGLARALLAQGQYEKVVSRFARTELTEAASQADLAVTLASAYFALGKLAEADASVLRAMQAYPKLASARILKAKLLATAKDLAAARELVEQVLVDHQNNADAWLLKGNLLATSGADARDSALDAYQQALQLDPHQLQAHAASMWVHFAKRDLAAAKKQLAAMQVGRTNHPMVLYFAAQLALEEGDLKLARDKAQALLKIAPEDPRALHVAGAVEYKRGALLQAESFLNKALKAMPEQIPTRLLLAQTYLRSGEAGKVISLLQPLFAGREPSAPASAYAYAAEALMQLGRVEQAESYYARASKLDPADSRSRTALAVAQIGRGKAEQGLAELHQIASADVSPVADLALISTHVRKREFEKALGAIDQLSKKQPNTVLPVFLRGQVLALKGNQEAARLAMADALKIDPVYYPATATLAKWDMAEKKTDMALQRFEQLLVRDSKNLRAQMAIVSLRAQAGAPYSELSDLLAKAIKSNPSDAAPRVALTRLQLDNKDAKQALVTAQDGLAAMPDSPEMLEMQGRAQVATGDINQATGTYSKLAAQQPDSPVPFMLLADLQMSQNNPVAAAQSLKKALAIKADFLPAQRGLLMLEMMSGRAPEARSIAKTVQSQHQSDAIGHTFEGDVDFSLKNWNAAANAYKAGLDKVASTDLAIKLHRSLMAAGKREDGQRMEAQWLSKYPKDAGFLYYLGDLASVEGNAALAEKRYRQVLDVVPDSSGAMNNVAWIMYKSKKAGALEYAQNAVKQAPKQAPFWDTLAAILNAQGNVAKSLEAQKRAVDLAPSYHGLRLTYVKYLIAAGQSAKAKEELAKLSAVTDDFPGREEVQALAKTL